MKLNENKTIVIAITIVVVIVGFFVNLAVSVTGLIVIDERENIEVVEVQDAFVIGDPPYLLMKTNSTRNNGVSRTLDLDYFFIHPGNILQFKWLEKNQWVLLGFYWRTLPAEDRPAEITVLK